jgi:microcystin-dependent protein
MSEPFLGEIRMVGWNFAANGWALCNGQLMSINQYQALFALLGTTYGGNGTTTFALPNLQGRVPIHQGTGLGLSPYTIGESSGSENITLLANQMPAHNHLMGVSNLPGAVADPTNAILVRATPERAGLQFPSLTMFRQQQRERSHRLRLHPRAAIYHIAIFSLFCALTSSR